MKKFFQMFIFALVLVVGIPLLSACGNEMFSRPHLDISGEYNPTTLLSYTKLTEAEGFDNSLRASTGYKIYGTIEIPKTTLKTLTIPAAKANMVLAVAMNEYKVSGIALKITNGDLDITAFAPNDGFVYVSGKAVDATGAISNVKGKITRNFNQILEVVDSYLFSSIKDYKLYMTVKNKQLSLGKTELLINECINQPKLTVSINSNDTMKKFKFAGEYQGNIENSYVLDTIFKNNVLVGLGFELNTKLFGIETKTKLEMEPLYTNLSFPKDLESYPAGINLREYDPYFTIVDVDSPLFQKYVIDTNGNYQDSNIEDYKANKSADVSFETISLKGEGFRYSSEVSVPEYVNSNGKTIAPYTNYHYIIASLKDEELNAYATVNSSTTEVVLPGNPDIPDEEEVIVTRTTRTTNLELFFNNTLFEKTTIDSLEDNRVTNLNTNTNIDTYPEGTTLLLTQKDTYPDKAAEACNKIYLASNGSTKIFKFVYNNPEPDEEGEEPPMLEVPGSTIVASHVKDLTAYAVIENNELVGYVVEYKALIENDTYATIREQISIL